MAPRRRSLRDILLMIPGTNWLGQSLAQAAGSSPATNQVQMGYAINQRFRQLIGGAAFDIEINIIAGGKFHLRVQQAAAWGDFPSAEFPSLSIADGVSLPTAFFLGIPPHWASAQAPWIFDIVYNLSIGFAALRKIKLNC